jgi:hypothetical protein
VESHDFHDDSPYFTNDQCWYPALSRAHLTLITVGRQIWHTDVVRKGSDTDRLLLRSPVVLRYIALNRLKQERMAKVGIKNKRLTAGWDAHYPLKVIAR